MNSLIVNDTCRNDNRYMRQFRFWLDANKPEQRALATQLDSHKAQRKYHSLLRDALRLVLDLRNGKTDELFRQFPDIGLKIAAQLGFSTPTRSASLPQSLPTSTTLTEPEDLLTLSAASNGKSAQNFIGSLYGLLGEKPPDDLFQKDTKPANQSASQIKTIAGSDVELCVPSFENFEDISLC